MAKYAIAGLVDDSGAVALEIFTSGFDEAEVSAMRSPTLGGTIVEDVLTQRRPVRVRGLVTTAEVVTAPPDLARPIFSLLTVPVASAARVLGWLSLRNKLVADEFSDNDERVALLLATHAAIAYENAQAADGLKRQLIHAEKQLMRTVARTRSVREEAQAPSSRRWPTSWGNRWPRSRSRCKSGWPRSRLL